MMTEDIHFAFASTTPHEAFTLMLLERLERLEDAHRELEAELRCFKSTVGDSVPYEWFRLEFCQPLLTDAGAGTEIQLILLREAWVNRVFSARSEQHPEFAYWCWWIEGSAPQQFRMRLYLRFQRPQTLGRLKATATATPPASAPSTTTTAIEIQPLQGGAAEMQRILMERFQNLHVFPHPSAEYGSDIWRRGGDPFESPLEESWVPGEFLKSANYSQSVHVRFLYMDWVMMLIKQDEWNHLFRLEEG